MFENVIEDKYLYDLYEERNIILKNVYGETEDFEVLVYQSAALSPYLFSLVIDEIKKGYTG